MYFILLGVLGILGGLSGHLVLVGTDSCIGAAVAGAVFLVIGIVSVATGKKKPSAQRRSGARRTTRSSRSTARGATRGGVRTAAIRRMR